MNIQLQIQCVIRKVIQNTSQPEELKIINKEQLMGKTYTYNHGMFGAITNALIMMKKALLNAR